MFVDVQLFCCLQRGPSSQPGFWSQLPWWPHPMHILKTVHDVQCSQPVPCTGDDEDWVACTGMDSEELKKSPCANLPLIWPFMADRVSKIENPMLLLLLCCCFYCDGIKRCGWKCDHVRKDLSVLNICIYTFTVLLPKPPCDNYIIFGDVSQLVEHQTGRSLRQVQFPSAARDFSPRVNFQCRLSYGVCTPPVYSCMH